MKRAQPDKSVAIVGASTSGLLTALLLARRGTQVTVFERAEELDPTQRTLIVTDKMHDFVGPLGARSVVNQIDSFELFANGTVGKVALGSPDLIIERSVLIRDLATEAANEGVELRLGSRFESVVPTGSALELTFRTSHGVAKVAATTLVGADGTQSRVARAAGWPQQPTVPLVQAIVPLPSDCETSTSRVWFRPQDSPYFYWLIPESDSHGALGLIGEEGTPPRPILDAFLSEKGFTAEGYQAARIPCYMGWINPYRRVGGGEVYLVGDAAGHVKVSTVGGIVTGFRGARAVTNSILTGARAREMASLRIELGLHLFLRRALHQFSTEDYCDLIDLLNDGVRDSLARFNRDETPELFLRVARTQPRLLFLMLRGLTGTKRFRKATLRSAA